MNEVPHRLFGLEAVDRQRNLRSRIPVEKRVNARRMRNNPTLSEAALWRSLRTRQLDGWKFRRQACLRGYIADFYCAELGLVIEVDGGFHNDRRAYDDQRDRHLANVGITTLRVTDATVVEQHDQTLSLIADVAQRRAACLEGRPQLAVGRAA